MNRIVPISLVALALSAGCTKKARYIDPDEESRVEGTGIESRDVRAVVAQMSSDLLENPVLDRQPPPRLAVLPVDNRTRFLIDHDIFNTLITDELIRQGQGKLAVVNRDLIDQILQERKMKLEGTVSDQGGVQALAGVDWFLEGELRSLSASTARAQTDYVVVRFQLTNAESGIVAWSDSYEMKKEGSQGVLYQ